jgi:prophage antirepressor-like protein
LQPESGACTKWLTGADVATILGLQQSTALLLLLLQQQLLLAG